tara:strand:+ start:152 stop:682 length:531 start_codon:yes stop_codon:yes gene_type:complete
MEDSFCEHRFDHIKEMGREKNFQSVYIIELKTAALHNSFTRSYPNVSAGFPPSASHASTTTRCFYVGTTWHSLEDRFHRANSCHMYKKDGTRRKIGMVPKHRLIEDDPPFQDSLNSLEQLTERYGHNNPGGIASTKFEHYVAWALYKKGHHVWGPKISELGKFFQDLKWLGEDPYI